MKVRRFVFDSQLGAVVELGQHNVQTVTPGDRYAEAKAEHQRRPSEATGKPLREAALDIAGRREWAHRRFGDERRWK